MVAIHCPKCGKDMKVRTSDRPTPQTVQALVYCNNCIGVRAQFMGQLTKIEVSEWLPAPELENSTFSKNKPKIAEL